MTLQVGQRFNSGEVRDHDGRNFTIEVGGVADTVSAGGSTAAAPASGSAIASIASGSLPAGVYKVEFGAWQNGAPDTNLTNLRVRRAASTIHDNLPSLATITPGTIPRVTVDGSQSLSLGVGAAAGGAGAIYSGFIRATRIE